MDEGAAALKRLYVCKGNFDIASASPVFLQTTMAKDPVCGMTVDEKTAKFRSAHDGRVFYFCSEACKESFDKDPHRFGHGK